MIVVFGCACGVPALCEHSKRMILVLMACLDTGVVGLRVIWCGAWKKSTFMFARTLAT